jgi:hypothetical protein
MYSTVAILQQSFSQQAAAPAYGWETITKDDVTINSFVDRNGIE